MSEPEWDRGDLDHRLTVLCVDPYNLTDVRGELADVTAASMTYGYYTDQRWSASLSTFGDDDGYVDQSALRLVHEVGGWSETLGTFYVTSRKWSMSDTVRTWAYELRSPLWALEAQLSPSHFTVGKGGKALDAARSIFSATGRPYSIDSNATDYMYGANTVWDIGESYLAMLYDIAGQAGDRVDVWPDGRVRVKRRVAASGLSAERDLDPGDARTVLGAGGMSGEVDDVSVPTRVIVYARQDDQEIVSVAGMGGRYARPVRGFSLDELHSESSLEPFSQGMADSLAKSYLSEASSAKSSVDAESMYFPVHDAQAVRLRADGAWGRYLVKSADIDLFKWTMSLSLEEA